MKRNILTFIQILLAGVLLFSSYKMAAYLRENQKRARTYDQIADQVQDYRSQTEEVPEDPARLAKELIDSLRVDNPDTVAYIEIPSIAIAYPVVQTGDNDFYLNHASDKSPNIGGAIFLDYLNGSDFKDDNSVLYGHQMKDGSMFKQLHSFRKEESFKGGPRIHLTTTSGFYTYCIFAAMPVMSDEDYRVMHFKSSNEKIDFLSYIKENADQFQSPPEEAKHFLTLSTCAYEKKVDRLAIYAYLEEDSQ